MLAMPGIKRTTIDRALGSCIMGDVIRLSDHARAAIGSRAAKAVNCFAVRPSAKPRSDSKTASHHSAGMLSRCHHLDTAGALAPMSVAMASREGQSSMIDLNEVSGIQMPIRQLVLKSKDILSEDVRGVFGQNVFMAGRNQSVSDFKKMFIARTAYARERSGKSQDEIAAELGMLQPTYSKYEIRTPLPHHLVMAFCALCDVTPAWLYTAAVPIAAAKPKRTRTKKAA